MAADVLATFHRALSRHEPETIAALARRIDPNARHKWGTPLVWAARWGDLALVELLVRRGAAVDQGFTHLTPVTWAASRGAADIVAFLRGRGATISVLTDVYLGERSRVTAALKRDPGSARLRDEEETPILHHAVESARPEMVALLLERGAAVTDTDANGETALHRIADMRRAPADVAVDIALLLVDSGADPDARNWDDVTPLHQAVRARNLGVAELLLERGADPNARDRSRGSTPLRRAVSSTGAGGTAGTAELMVPLARLLLEHGADPDAKDRRGVPVRASARDPRVRALLAAHRAPSRPPRHRR